jgi:hypothetical protein
MFNVFEQPWTLLGVSVLVLLGVMTFRSVWPERWKPRYWLLPLGMVGIAFGLDALVTTDLEKVHAATNASIRAVEREDTSGVMAWIAPNYSDSRHHSKADLARECREQLGTPTVAKIRKISDDVKMVSPTEARQTLILSIKLEEQSRVVKQHGFTGCIAKVQLTLTKQPDKRWLISRVELQEANQIPVTWSDV